MKQVGLSFAINKTSDEMNVKDAIEAGQSKKKFCIAPARKGVDRRIVRLNHALSSDCDC